MQDICRDKVLIPMEFSHATIFRDGHRVIDALSAQETAHLVRLLLGQAARELGWDK